MKSIHRCMTGLAAVVLAVGMSAPFAGCGGGGGGSSSTTTTTAAETAGVAGSWSGTWSEGAEVSTFEVSIDCSGGLTGTLTPTAGDPETVSGTVTTWDATSGAFEATLSRNGESETLTGVVHSGDLTGSFKSDTGAAGNFVVSLSGSTLICNAAQIAEGSAGDSVSTDLTSTVDDAATTCSGDGAVPYGGSPVVATATGAATGNVAVLLKPRTLDDGTQVVDVIMTFAPTDTTPQVGVVGTTTDTGSEMHFTGVGTTSGSDYLATLDTTLTIDADGSLSGTFTGTVDADGDGDLTGTDDCTAIGGTFSGEALAP